MPGQPEPGTRSSVAPIVLLVLAALAYLFMLANAIEAPQLESIDKGIASIFALVGLVGLWLLLAAMLTMAAVREEMPVWALILAPIAHPLWGAAALAALFDWIDRPDAQAAILILALPPPLLAFYALYPISSKLRTALPAPATAAIILGAVAMLSAGQLVYKTTRDIREAAERREQDRIWQERKAREQAEKQRLNRARLDRLTDDSPLADWAEFIGKGNDLEKEAIARIRRLPHRQADAEAMLARDDAFPLFHIGDLDLEATREFCAATGGFLVKDAETHRPSSPDDMYWKVSDRFEPFVNDMRWLVDHHCDLEPAIAAIETTVGAYPPAQDRDKFLATLARVRPEWRRCLFATAAEQRIASCDAIIQAGTDIPENHAGAYAARGDAYLDLGEVDRALSDDSEALRIRPEYPAVLNNRGNAYEEKGEHDRAIADYEAAIAQSPDFEQAFRNRGRAKFFRGDFGPAEADFGRALELLPENPYPILWRYLARARSGQAAPDELRQAAAPLDHAEWPWPVIAAFLGETDRAAVIAAAQQGKPDAIQQQGCEAAFFLGEKAVLERDYATARELLSEGAKVCRPGSIEYPSSRFELARLP
ncbi:MAG TPA: tetratricopeptide repeat protein [Stellaceae bacterium]|jgi:lipoprotein NlpI|nr:tetratricopeptide repeat protein [Stellaceae bacterium]